MQKVLIVEDDADIRESLKEFLEFEDFEVSEAGDGLEALKSLEISLPSIILLDLTLPNMDGAELMKILNQRADRKKFKVILGSGWDDLRETAAELKADDFIRKPYKIDSLISLLKSV